MRLGILLATLVVQGLSFLPVAHAAGGLSLAWDKNILTIRGDSIPGGFVRVLYLEAYCRPGSTNRDWHETVIGHTTELLHADPSGQSLRLRCTLRDGVRVEHVIYAGKDEVVFDLTAHNPTGRTSQAHWAQPCIRVDRFTGADQQSYLKKCFVFLDGKLTRMPTPVWATQARYTPGQVWCPRHVDRNDVNPRPLNPLVPSNGLIGCFSADETMLLATAWEPYQELFQGVIVCIHADFRLGGLAPGETKKIRGKIYILPADVPALLTRYRRDFPEHISEKSDPSSGHKP
ncbi:MAG: hypothetical protein C4297_11545 [Gemmataceae bacterium]